MISHPKEMHAEGVDLLLRVSDPPESGLIARKMGQLRFGVYASAAYLELAGTPATPEGSRRRWGRFSPSRRRPSQACA